MDSTFYESTRLTGCPILWIICGCALGHSNWMFSWYPPGWGKEGGVLVSCIIPKIHLMTLSCEREEVCPVRGEEVDRKLKISLNVEVIDSTSNLWWIQRWTYSITWSWGPEEIYFNFREFCKEIWTQFSCMHKIGDFPWDTPTVHVWNFLKLQYFSASEVLLDFWCSIMFWCGQDVAASF